jgi:hypothetical protein
VKTGQIFGSSGHKTNPRFESLRIGLANPDSQICAVRIRDYDTKRIHGFAKRIHVFTNLLYYSRILSLDPDSTYLIMNPHVALGAWWDVVT